MKDQKEMFDKGVRAPRTESSRYYEYHILKARKAQDSTLVRKLIAERAKTPSIDYGSSEYKRLSYVRYADD